MDKVRVALIGAGSMANTMHYPSLARMPDVELVGLCDLVPEKLRATAEKFRIEKTFTDYKKMLEATAPQAVYILMPPHHLYDLAAHCLNEKRHVFIEKPPGLTAQQTRMLALKAEKNGCLTMTGFQRRHIPLAKKLRAIVEQKSPIHSCVCTFYKNHVGAGPYYDGAIDILTSDCIHAVDTLRWMAGAEVRRVVSDVRRLYADFETAFYALLKFENDVTGILLGNWMTGRRFFTMEMHTQGASAFIDPDDKGVVYMDNQVEGQVFDSKAAAGFSEPYMYLGFYDENRHFIDCIRTGQAPTSCFADALKTMELVDRIYHSQV